MVDTQRSTESLRWQFDNVDFDESRWELSVGGQRVELERKPMELLRHLLRHVGEVMTKDELLETVWPGRVVVEAVLTNAVTKLRKALGPTAMQRVVTVARVGYRFEGPVQRKASARIAEHSPLKAGDPVPRRNAFRLMERFASHEDAEVWLAEQRYGNLRRVFKFSLDGARLQSLKREVTLSRVLHAGLGERDDLVRFVDWDFDEAPFFIEFEYAGLPLDRWLLTHPETDRKARLDLMARIATTLGDAHGIGVLHKDLKPANILVEGTPDTELHVRLADFGSGRQLSPERLDALALSHNVSQDDTPASTSAGGTLLYMAPELLEGQSASIRSDIYSLGLLAYQVLSGNFQSSLSPGWEGDIGDAQLIADIVEFANRDPALRPDSAHEMAVRFRTLDERHSKANAAKAERERVAESDRKIELQRARKPWLIAAMVSMILGLAITGVLLQRSLSAERQVAKERDEARKQAKRAQAVVDFLSNDLIRSVTPDAPGFENDPTIREMLDYASKTAPERFANDPDTRATLHSAMGSAYGALHERERSASHFQKASQDFAGTHGTQSELALEAKYNVAQQLALAGQFGAALNMAIESDRDAGTQLNADSKVAFWSAYTHGQIHAHQQNLPEAEKALNRADRLRKKWFADNWVYRHTIALMLGDVDQRQGKFTEVIARFKDDLDDPDLKSEEMRNIYRVNIAKLLRMQGKIDEAMPYARAAVESSEKILGTNAPATLVRRSELSVLLSRAGRCPEALAMDRESYERALKHIGEKSRSTITLQYTLSRRELGCGDAKRALTLVHTAMNNSVKYFPESPESNSYRYYFANDLEQAGRNREALEQLQRVNAEKLATSSSSPAAAHWIAIAKGRNYIALGDIDKGRELISNAIDGAIAMGIDSNANAIREARKFLQPSTLN